jgi:hypothetical protein
MHPDLSLDERRFVASVLAVCLVLALTAAGFLVPLG